jgi:5-methylthioribose kinase
LKEGQGTTVEPIDPSKVAQYFSDRGWFPGQTVIGVEDVVGGVSNTVLRVTLSDRDVILKQPLPRLRVAEEWLSDIARASNEAAGLRLARCLLPETSSPLLLYEDATDHVLVMEAAPRGIPTWKQRLLGGHVSSRLAAAAGNMLGALHRGSWHNAAFAQQFQEGFRFFVELRLAPYFEFLLARLPQYRQPLEMVMGRLRSERVCLVHGDFSPKNLLVTAPSALMLIDWEVIHFGNPVFDAGFLLTHLTLKTIHANRAPLDQLAFLTKDFWVHYAGAMKPLSPEFTDVLPVLGCLLLARVDGKSPAEYLSADEQAFTRKWAHLLLTTPPGTSQEYVDTLKEWLRHDRIP